MNQFIWVPGTTDAHFVQKYLKKGNTCKIIFEHILVNYHSNVRNAAKNLIKNLIVILTWEIVIFINLQLNKYLLRDWVNISSFFSIDRMNQFIWATRTSGAHFVQTNIEPNIICNIIFELILVNSHSNAIYATRNIIKNQDVMLMLEHVHQKMNSWIYSWINIAAF